MSAKKELSVYSKYFTLAGTDFKNPTLPSKIITTEEWILAYPDDAKSLTGNGSRFRNDGKYIWDKQYRNPGKPQSGVLSVQCVGLNPNQAAVIPYSIYSWFREQERLDAKSKACVFCGSHNKLSIDHKDPFKMEDPGSPNSYQWACDSHQSKKREVFKRFKDTGEVPDAIFLDNRHISHLPIESLEPQEVWKKTYFYDPKAFAAAELVILHNQFLTEQLNVHNQV